MMNGVATCENAAGSQAIETTIKHRIRPQFNGRDSRTIFLPAKADTAVVHAQNRPTVGAEGFVHEWCDYPSADVGEDDGPFSAGPE